MRIDDAALHDRKVLITRRRDIKLAMLSLVGHTDRVHDGFVTAFEALKYDLITQHTLGQRFHKIELPPLASTSVCN